MKKLVNDMKAMLGKSRQTGRKNPKGSGQRGLNGKPVPIVTSGPVVNDMFTRGIMAKRQLGKGRSMGKLSVAGDQFLKAAFAAPDFANQGAFQGIPDDKTYKVIPTRHLLSADLNSLGIIWPDDPKVVLGLIQMPVPGVAFYWFLVNPAVGVTVSTVFHPVYYSSFESLFGYNPDENLSNPQENSDQVVEFRMAANTMELICTSNSVTWKGSLRAFKLSAQLEQCQTYTPTGSTAPIPFKISGLTGAASTGAASFITPSNLGVYMSALNKEVIFQTRPILDKIVNVNDLDSINDGVVNGNLTGFGDLECNVILIEGQEVGYPTHFTIRTWQCVEYVPNEKASILYEMAKPSPSVDLAALNIYRELVAELPIAVTYFENDTFWKRLLSTVSRIGSSLSVIPGPWGALAGSIGGLSGTIASMV